MVVRVLFHWIHKKKCVIIYIRRGGKGGVGKVKGKSEGERWCWKVRGERWCWKSKGEGSWKSGRVVQARWRRG